MKSLASEKWLQRHIYAYVIVNVSLFALNKLLPGQWWSFWVLYSWGVVLALHFFFVRSLNVDEDWVEERADRVKMRSYDVSHMEDIGDRIRERDDSVYSPSDGRKPPQSD